MTVVFLVKPVGFERIEKALPLPFGQHQPCIAGQ
jgi:hypothetical protein